MKKLNQKIPVSNSDLERKSRGRRRRGVSFPILSGNEELPEDYAIVLGEIKERIQTERLRVVMTANAAMVILYWDIGRAILKRQEHEGWGAKVIDRLSVDLREAFPDMRGLSPRNLKYMRSFAVAWTNRQFVQEVLAQITWYHNITLLEKVADSQTRLWYAMMARENGWSCNILAMQIKACVHNRQGKAINNFILTLPPADSDIDLLFYHLKLRCYVVVELKVVPFDPGFTGTLNMYLSAVDDLLRHPDDKPTIGLLLCRSKNKVVVEYALRGFQKPIGVADWETAFVNSLPKELKGSLPTVEEIEAELMKEENAK